MPRQVELTVRARVTLRFEDTAEQSPSDLVKHGLTLCNALHPGLDVVPEVLEATDANGDDLFGHDVYGRCDGCETWLMCDDYIVEPEDATLCRACSRPEP